MSKDELVKRVKDIKSRSLNFEWGTVQKMLIQLDKDLKETPADIKAEKDGYWL